MEIRRLHPNRNQLLGSDDLEAHRVAKADEMVGRCRRKPKASVKIELLVRRYFVRSAEIDDVLRPSTLRKGAGVFNPGIPRRSQLPVEIDAALPGSVSLQAPVCRSLRRPRDREHSRHRPVLRQSPRPRQLHHWIVAMARDRVRSRRKADRWNERHIKSLDRPQLLFETEAHITETRGRASPRRKIPVVIRNHVTKLGLPGNTKSNRRLGKIVGLLASSARLLETVLKLQAPARNYNARTRDLWPVSGDRAHRITAARRLLGQAGDGSSDHHNDQNAKMTKHPENSNWERLEPSIIAAQVACDRFLEFLHISRMIPAAISDGIVSVSKPC
jgi:hypothetical protein